MCDIKAFYSACLDFLKSVEKELTPIDGYYYVNYSFIKKKCGEMADSVFFELSISDITLDAEYEKALLIEHLGIEHAIRYYMDRIVEVNEIPS